MFGFQLRYVLTCFQYSGHQAFLTKEALHEIAETILKSLGSLAENGILQEGVEPLVL